MNRSGNAAFAALALAGSIAAAAVIYAIGDWKLLAVWLLW